MWASAAGRGALVYIWHNGEEETVGGGRRKDGEHRWEADAHTDFADPVNFWGRASGGLRKDPEPRAAQPEGGFASQS